MDWYIDLSKQASQFLKKEKKLSALLPGIIESAIKKLQGGDSNVDLKRLSGEWEGFLRIRKGRVRIICRFDFDHHVVKVAAIDYRGNVY